MVPVIRTDIRSYWCSVVTLLYVGCCTVYATQPRVCVKQAYPYFQTITCNLMPNSHRRRRVSSRRHCELGIRFLFDVIKTKVAVLFALLFGSLNNVCLTDGQTDEQTDGLTRHHDIFLAMVLLCSLITYVAILVASPLSRCALLLPPLTSSPSLSPPTFSFSGTRAARTHTRCHLHSVAISSNNE